MVPHRPLPTYGKSGIVDFRVETAFVCGPDGLFLLGA